MKSKLKFFGISALFLFLLITAIGLLFPSSIIVSRAINIPAPKENILPLTHQLNNWSKWMQGANNLTVKDALNASLNNTSITTIFNNDSSIQSKWIDSKGKEQVSTINLYKQKDITIVQWQFQENFSWYPWQRFSSMFNEKIMGPVLEVSLDSLKSVVIRNNLNSPTVK